ncbi:hypothetical protein ACKUB1_06165 [Methanospirillum stamsii]|uniref:Uncharacterized protein n=1 Tax=Methanospirillum stamsii TaxID=1277351 RepID=A0A2V2NHT2_9EURY|nr:hypothetical protein [Methanospirillum stamsii]PWR75151.1 hypothetical protein DLD82_06105 [Methanospirillum stamsii]
MNRNIRIILYGIIVWLIPFLVAIPFYSPDGTIQVSDQLFKSIMIVTGSIVGAYLLIRLFSDIQEKFIQTGWIIGGIWLIINWFLDAVILLPLNGMDPATYFSQIGLRYLMIPVMSIMGGYIGENAKKGRIDPSAYH